MEFIYLADREYNLPVVAEWYFNQWGRRNKEETLERTTGRLRDYLNRDKIPFVLLAVEGNDLLGAAQLKYREMGDLFPEKEHWIGGVYVANNYRGRGIGTTLAEEIANRATEYGIQILHLQTEMLNGGLYKKLGWIPVQQVNNRGLEVLVMQRELVPNNAPKWAAKRRRPLS